MYRINNLNRPVLIVPDEVLFHAPTDQGVDARQILPSIIVAEERFIANAICDEFYEELIKLKNRVVTKDNQADLIEKINQSQGTEITAKDIPIGTIINAIEFVQNEDYRLLWDRFLWKITAEAVDFMTTVPSWLRHTSQGQQKNNPETIGSIGENGPNSASGDRRDVQFKMDKQLQDRIDPLIERMHFWLCKRKDKFPLYTKNCACDDDGVSLERKTGWVFGAYDKEPDSCGCKTVNWIEWPR